MRGFWPPRYYLFLTCAHPLLIHAGNMSTERFLCLYVISHSLPMHLADDRRQMTRMNERRKQGGDGEAHHRAPPLITAIRLPKMSQFGASATNMGSFKSLLNCTYPVLSVSLSVPCLSFPLSSLRLGVSQRIPGVCCIRGLCCLAGRSVWRLHLVSA